MATQPQATVTTEYDKYPLTPDQRAILEIVIAETEKARAIMEREAADLRTMEDVAFGSTGLVPKSMAGLWRMAKMYAGSAMVPEHFQGKPHDCCIGIQMALRCGVDPMAFLQKCYVVYGRPSIEATLAIAMANTSGKLKGRITYELSGDGNDRQCRAMATLADTGEVISMVVSLRDAHSMGWWAKKDSLWPKIPEMMLRYRSATWLLRTHLPEVLMGIYTIDEVRDTGGAIGEGVIDMGGTPVFLPPTDAKPIETPPSAKGAVSGDDLAKPKGRKKADKPTDSKPVETPEPETKPAEQDTAPVAEEAKTQETLLPADDEPDAEPGTGRNTDVEMDEEMYAVLASRVARCQTAADCNAVDTEQKRFDMTAHQRARIVLAIKAKRGEVGK